MGYCMWIADTQASSAGRPPLSRLAAADFAHACQRLAISLALES